MITYLYQVHSTQDLLGEGPHSTDVNQRSYMPQRSCPQSLCCMLQGPHTKSCNLCYCMSEKKDIHKASFTIKVLILFNLEEGPKIPSRCLTEKASYRALIGNISLIKLNKIHEWCLKFFHSTSAHIVYLIWESQYKKHPHTACLTGYNLIIMSPKSIKVLILYTS